MYSFKIPPSLEIEPEEFDPESHLSLLKDLEDKAAERLDDRGSRRVDEEEKKSREAAREYLKTLSHSVSSKIRCRLNQKKVVCCPLLFAASLCCSCIYSSQRTKMESNAAFVRWSDGSLGFQVGDEYYDVVLEDISKDNRVIYVLLSFHLCFFFSSLLTVVR